MCAIKQSSSCVLSPPAADQKKINICAGTKLFQSAINKQTDSMKMYYCVIGRYVPMFLKYITNSLCSSLNLGILNQGPSPS